MDDEQKPELEQPKPATPVINTNSSDVPDSPMPGTIISASTPGQPETQPIEQQPIHPTIPETLPSGKKSLLKNRKPWLLAVLLAIIIVVVVILLMPSSSKKVSLSNSSKNSKNSSLPKVSSPNSASATNNSALPAGSNNSSLNSDLNSVNSSMKQENSDQGSTNNSLNDSSQQISVPTN